MRLKFQQFLFNLKDKKDRPTDIQVIEMMLR